MGSVKNNEGVLWCHITHPGPLPCLSAGPGRVQAVLLSACIALSFSKQSEQFSAQSPQNVLFAGKQGFQIVY